MTEQDGSRILHCFADDGVESEALGNYGEVVRVGLDPSDRNTSMPLVADASEPEQLPFREEEFDLALLHPPCTRWADMTSIDGDPEDHPDLIEEAREIGELYADHYIIENKPAAPLRDPVVLEGRMFGLPIKYARAFETSFDVEQPVRNSRLGEPAETSPFFYSERPTEWWAAAKGYPTGRYPKEHLAKNCLPAPYVHHLARGWIRSVEAETGAAEGRPDYSDYDNKMETKRRREANSSLDEWAVVTDGGSRD